MAIRIVQIGMGGWGQIWGGIVRGSTDAELVACVDMDPAALAQARKQLGIQPERTSKRLGDGHWPAASVVSQLFGTWQLAREAAAVEGERLRLLGAIIWARPARGNSRVCRPSSRLRRRRPLSVHQDHHDGKPGVMWVDPVVAAMQAFRVLARAAVAR